MQKQWGRNPPPCLVKPTAVHRIESADTLGLVGHTLDFCTGLVFFLLCNSPAATQADSTATIVDRLGTPPMVSDRPRSVGAVGMVFVQQAYAALSGTAIVGIGLMIISLQCNV